MTVYAGPILDGRCAPTRSRSGTFPDKRKNAAQSQYGIGSRYTTPIWGVKVNNPHLTQPFLRGPSLARPASAKPIPAQLPSSYPLSVSAGYFVCDAIVRCPSPSPGRRGFVRRRVGIVIPSEPRRRGILGRATQRRRENETLRLRPQNDMAEPNVRQREATGVGSDVPLTPARSRRERGLAAAQVVRGW